MKGEKRGEKIRKMVIDDKLTDLYHVSQSINNILGHSNPISGSVLVYNSISEHRSHLSLALLL